MSNKRINLGFWAIIVLVIVVLLGAPTVVLLVNNRPPHISIPSHKVPKDNGLDDVLLGSDTVRGCSMQGPTSSGRPASWWTSARYETWMKVSAAGRPRIHSGIPKRFCWPPERGLASLTGTSFERFARVREAARILLSECKCYADAGDYSSAAGSAWDCLELGAICPRGGGLFHWTVSDAVFRIGKNDLPSIVPRLQPASLDEAARRLRRIRRRWVPLSEAVAEEGRIEASVYAEMFCDRDIRNEVVTPWEWPSESPVLSGQSSRSKLQLATQNAKLAFSNKIGLVRANAAFFRAFSQEVRRPYTGHMRTPVPGNAVLHSNLFSQTSGTLLGTSGFDALGIWASSVYKDAQFTLLETDVALRRYKARHGQYPAKLSQLVPALLPRVPQDPFGGKPIHYKRTGPGFLVYSVGPDLKDNGGTPAPQRDATAKGDVFWDKP